MSLPLLAAREISSSTRGARSSSTIFFTPPDLGEACEKLRHFSVEGTRLNCKRIDEMGRPFADVGNRASPDFSKRVGASGPWI